MKTSIKPKERARIQYDRGTATAYGRRALLEANSDKASAVCTTKSEIRNHLYSCLKKSR